MNVVHAIIPKSGSLTINTPADFNTAVYFLKGSANAGEKTAGLSDMIILNNDGDEFTLTANEDTEILLLSGEPINEPVVQYGSFVMNTMGEIKEAFLEYREGKFGNLS